jgi:hypothetical protein
MVNISGTANTEDWRQRSEVACVADRCGGGGYDGACLPKEKMIFTIILQIFYNQPLDKPDSRDILVSWRIR